MSGQDDKKSKTLDQPKTHDEARRAFLVGAAVGAVASTGLVPGAHAQGHDGHADAGAHAHAMADGDGHGAFFNDDDTATMVAFTERLWPAAPDKPGATEAGVVNYIDLAVAGAYADQQDFYRRGLTQLDAYCHATYKRGFAALTPAQQDEVVGALAAGKADGFTYPTAQAFFRTLRTHTMEGMFGDPVYGGNRDFAGWQLIGFPGAQMQYTEADLKSDKAFTRLPITGLQAQAKKRS
jgi:gluconate 2-dehydrogenase gamma chain